MTRRATLWLALPALAAAILILRGPERVAPGALPSLSGAEPSPPPLVLFRGNEGSAVSAAQSALERVLATSIGAKARELLESGVLGAPLTIELNQRGENFTHYRLPGRVLGETIAFDPSSRPLVETELGRLPAQPETVLAHELGHAVFKLTSEEDVIHAIENPVREQMGLPRRSRF